MDANLQSTMREAMRLMKTGDLVAATEAIKHRIGGQPLGNRGTIEPLQSETIEGVFRTVEQSIPPGDAEVHRSDAPEKTLRPQSSQFTDHRYEGLHGARRYKLFIPSKYRGQPLPLIVMLHGCTQTPDDFATGTRMNVIAERESCFVAYPAQEQSANVSKCWNWFKVGDQRRGQGEPAIIAGLARELALKYSIDENRIYVGGMSAGGAMAVILGWTYPDVFAAVGVHSGLPYAAAHDLPSALAAMRAFRPGQASGSRGETPQEGPPPTIIFHGDCDTTVDPCNGDQVAAEAVDATRKNRNEGSEHTPSAVETVSVEEPGVRSYTRTVFRSSSGEILAEHWLVHGGTHVWFGGDTRGTYTDPLGPDASAAMMGFFLQRSKKSSET